MGPWTSPSKTAGIVLIIVPKIGTMLSVPAMNPSNNEKSTPNIHSPSPVSVPLMQHIMS